MRGQKGKLETLDYAFLFGMPVLFLLVAWFGLTSLLPKGPPPDPVKILRSGAVRAGMGPAEVRRLVGLPKATVDLGDGAFEYVYRRTIYDNDVSMDDAFVEFTSDARVRVVRFERVAGPPVPAEGVRR